MKRDFAPLLLGKDLRSIGRVHEVMRFVDDQEDFNDLFNLLFHQERLLVMRAADAIEKITIAHPEWLLPHKGKLLGLLRSSLHKELKWHLSLLVARVDLTSQELKEVWDILTYWLKNPNESKIVRVNSLQGLYDLSHRTDALSHAFMRILRDLEHERIPSLQARIRKIKRRS